MSKTKSDTTKTSTTPKDSAKATWRTEIQKKAEVETSQGFRGVEVDTTPNENYTVAGVVKGAPTPETDAKQAAKVREETGIGLSALEAAEREKRGK